MRSKTYHKERRLMLKAAGLCIWCAQPATPGRTRCEPCAVKARAVTMARQRRMRPALRKLGICLVCFTRRVVPRTTRCGACAEQHTIQEQKRHDRLRSTTK